MTDLDLPEVSQDRTLRDVLSVLFRHRRKCLAVFLGLMGIVTLITFLTPDYYESGAKFLVRLGREQLTLDPTVTTGQVVDVQQSREAQLNSEVEILKSRQVTTRVIDRLGAEKFLGRAAKGFKGSPEALKELALRKLEKSWQIEVVHETSIITVTYRATDPAFAKSVVERLLESYLEEHIAAFRTSGSFEFFDRQTDTIQNTLGDMEGDLRDLRNQMSVGKLDDQRSNLMDRIGGLERMIAETGADRSAARAKIASMKQTLQDLPETLVTQETSGHQSSAVGAMRAKLYDLQLREQDLLSRYKDTSEPVVEIRRQIAEAENLLKTESKNLTEVTRGLSAAHQQVKSALLSEGATLSALDAKAIVLEANLAKAREELKELNNHEVNIAQLERQKIVAENNFRKYSESREQARIDQALEMDRISNISIVQQPTLVMTPVAPNRPLNILIGILLGLFGAIGAAVAGEFLDQSIRTARDVKEQLGLDTIITIPQLSTKAPAPRLEASTATLKELPAGPMDPVEMAQTEGVVRSRIGMYGESLRDGLMKVGNGDGTSATPRILAVTGCSGGEGVSTIAASIAGTLRAEGAGRILLIDTSAIYRSKEDDRFVLPEHAVQRIGGGNNGSPPRPLAWKTGEDFLNLLRREGSFVVLDCPPVLESATAARLCHLADSVILVVESEKTRRHVAREARTRLRLANANVRGVVLNKKHFHLPTWLYERL